MARQHFGRCLSRRRRYGLSRQADDFIGDTASATDRHISFRPVRRTGAWRHRRGGFSVTVGAIMVTALLVELLRGQRAISLHASKGLAAGMASDILKVARPASLNPLMNVATILGLTALVGQFGTQALAGYGIGTRIEFVMLPVIFAFGTALTTIVGTNIGAGNYDRAELAGRYGMTSAALYAERLAAFWPCFPIFGYRFSPMMQGL